MLLEPLAPRPFALHGEGALLCVEIQGHDLSCLGDVPFFEYFAGLKRPSEATEPRSLASFGQLRALSSADYGRGCLVEADGTMSCWGSAASWAPVSPRGPYPLPGLTVIDVAVSAGHSCLVDDAGQVACWGIPLCRRGAEPSPMVIMEGHPRSRRVDVGLASACSLDTEGHVTCWGQLDHETETCSQATRIEPLEDIVQVGVGDHFACVLDRTGEVSCWGTNRFNQLGRRDAPSSSVPAAVPGVRAVQLEVEELNACARAEDGRVWCWGGGFREGDPAEPIARDATDVFAGNNFACIQRSNGSVHCFGSRTEHWPTTEIPLESWQDAAPLWPGYDRGWIIHQALAQGLYEGKLGTLFRDALEAHCAERDCHTAWPAAVGPDDPSWTRGWLRDVRVEAERYSLKTSVHRTPGAYTLRTELVSDLTPAPVTVEHPCERTNDPEYLCGPSGSDVIMPPELAARLPERLAPAARARMRR